MLKAGKRIHPVVKLAVCVVILCYFAGCASVGSQWQQAKSKDTKQAYRAFIHKYPNSPHTDKARKALELMSWKQAKSTNTRYGYRRFLKDFPDGVYRKEALLAIESNDLGVAKKKNTKKAFVQFFKDHPNGALKEQAKGLLEAIEWQMAKRQRTFHAYRQFLKDYPDGKFNKQAKGKVAEGTWIEIQSRGSLDDFEKFLADFPKSRFAKKARARLLELKKTEKNAELHFNRIRGSKYFKSFSEFIWKYPSSNKVPLAVEAVYNLLRRKFPAEKYTCSPSLARLKVRLPEAIRNRRPLLVAFAPKVVTSKQKRWEWTSHFREVAGTSVFFNHMSPRINTKEGKRFTFAGGGDGMLGSCHIRPYGSCKHTWKCWGDFEGATVNLNYGKGMVISRTTLAIKQ